ncbi:hypothetical protein EZV73_26760 [Acidaminobacter sp. JC074]|uniref:hypothetical protein n=1 Tax=Acidaminobacter sp. JC074 TaxID=2530199 RepID=UPI001F0D27EB|nr:hypothetical protein [Acidaminobacter sp. JC074]MCH4891209.1 hypothetical protein [Acidaminobacter sp. JC074]
MTRVIEQLELSKIDLKDAIADKIIENSVLEQIVTECKDELEVKFIKECIDDNEDIIKESKEILVEVNEAIEILSICLDSKKRP